MSDYTITYPCSPNDPGAQAERIRKMLTEGFDTPYSETIPPVFVDYQEYAVNTVFQRAFSKLFLPTGVKWIDYHLEREGFKRSFQDNMKRMLNTGEYFAVLSVMSGKIRIDRLPKEWVRSIGVYEKTGELLLLIYVEPVILPQRSGEKARIGWKKTTMTPEQVTVALSTDENHPDDEEQYRIVGRSLNKYGFIPVVPFKLGTRPRGEPVWWHVRDQIDQINNIVNDLRMINAYNAAPVKWVKTDGEFQGIGPYGYVEMGLEDEIGALTIEAGRSLTDELAIAVGIFSDILGAPITSILQVGKHASGEAIEKRLDTLTRKAKQLREYVGNQMELMFRMMSALIAQGLVDGIDFNDPVVAPLLTEHVALADDPPEYRQETDLKYYASLGEPIDLAAYEVPEVRWEPIEELDPQGLLNLANAFEKLMELGLLTREKASIMLNLNFDQFVAASDLASHSAGDVARIDDSAPTKKESATVEKSEPTRKAS